VQAVKFLYCTYFSFFSVCLQFTVNKYYIKFASEGNEANNNSRVSPKFGENRQQWSDKNHAWNTGYIVINIIPYNVAIRWASGTILPKILHGLSFHTVIHLHACFVQIHPVSEEIHSKCLAASLQYGREDTGFSTTIGQCRGVHHMRTGLQVKIWMSPTWATLIVRRYNGCSALPWGHDDMSSQRDRSTEACVQYSCALKRNDMFVCLAAVSIINVSRSTGKRMPWRAL